MELLFLEEAAHQFACLKEWTVITSRLRNLICSNSLFTKTIKQGKKSICGCPNPILKGYYMKINKFIKISVPFIGKKKRREEVCIFYVLSVVIASVIAACENGTTQCIST